MNDFPPFVIRTWDYPEGRFVLAWCGKANPHVKQGKTQEAIAAAKAALDTHVYARAEYWVGSEVVGRWESEPPRVRSRP
jgi:hypothetical protein